MKAAVLHALGERPRFEEFPDPVPGKGEALVRVLAASLKPVDKARAAGSHYASPRELPAVCGVDGMGLLEDGARVFFGVRRSPYGAMAERAAAPRAFCFPVPDSVDDVTAAALPNPGLSSWLPLSWRARLAPGETVLILGATGVAGRLATQIAKLLGAGRVVAAGRNEDSLRSLRDLGADATISIGEAGPDLTDAFAREAGESGFDVILDYVWGEPTEALIAALARTGFAAVKPNGVRLAQIGEGAGPAISLSADALRSAGLTIMGAGGIPPLDLITDAYQQLMAHAANGKIHIDTEAVPLAQVDNAWGRADLRGRRLVFIP